MKILKSILVGVTLIVAFTKCANPLRPTGGPKDTIPPTLISSFPLSQAINVKSKEITLSFDEYINADKLKQKLIITPTTEIKYKQTIKKSNITLQFEEAFEDSTTYTLNFFDGITDLTEKNPAENLILAFSTGNYIDSLKCQGVINDLYTDEPGKKMTVGLYSLSDSLDISKHKPTYFITSLDDGSFTIQNIRYGKYRLFAFLDENKNLLFDGEKESYALSKDTITPSFTPDTLELKSIKLNASDLKLISARSNGKYYEVRFSKPINRYQVVNLDSTEITHTSLLNEKDVIRFYQGRQAFTDSIGIKLTVSDTVNNNLIDTLYVSFKESSRKKGEMSHTLLPKAASPTDKTTSYTLNFNKPVLNLDTILPVIKYDTFYTHKPNLELYNWNDNRTSLKFKIDFDEKEHLKILDTLINTYRPDTTAIDSTKIYNTDRINKIAKDRYKITFSEGLFITADYDTTKSIEQEYRFIKPTELGQIKFLLTTEKTDYWVELINKQHEIIAAIKDCKACTYSLIPPGDYTIRIKLDSNKNGVWDITKIKSWEESEPIIHFKEYTTLRANWTVELNYSF